MPGKFGVVSSACLMALISCSVAQAQSTLNGLAPNLAPYAPTAPPGTPGPTTSKGSAKPGAAGSATASEASPLQAPAAGGYDYVLGPEDKLRITVFGEDTLSGEFIVAGNGRLSFPLIGDVEAAGKTVRAVQDEITTALRAGYLRDPRVSAEVLSFRPFYIFGEVAKPGEYPYSDGITVMNAVAAAGGFTYRANQKYIFIKKATDATEHKVRLTEAIQLAPGDTVRIIERYF